MQNVECVLFGFKKWDVKKVEKISTRSCGGRDSFNLTEKIRFYPWPDINTKPWRHINEPEASLFL